MLARAGTWARRAGCDCTGMPRRASAGHYVIGPLSADTAFTAQKQDETDAYLAMFHDQGLPVLKALGFGDAVNVTLGLPIIRTSVDHGTALELAGTGQASASSLQSAITLAGNSRWVRRRLLEQLV